MDFTPGCSVQRGVTIVKPQSRRERGGGGPRRCQRCVVPNELLQQLLLVARVGAQLEYLWFGGSSQCQWLQQQEEEEEEEYR